MIKFFKKIRQQLLTENKFSKYLLYAIGEIVLVVLGIMIALSFNNRNELQKNEQTVILALREIQENLLEDIELSQIDLHRYLLQDSAFDEIFDFRNPLTYDDYKGYRNSGTRRGFGTFVNYFVNNKNGYENLMNHLDKIPIHYEFILSDLRELYVAQSNEIEVVNDRIRNTVNSHLDFLHNQNFYLDELRFGEVSEEELDYFINNDSYKNYLIKYMTGRTEVGQRSLNYRFKAIETYMKIHSLLNTKDTELPLEKLGAIMDTSNFEKYLGTYNSLDNPYVRRLNIYFEQDQLFVSSRKDQKAKGYRISDKVFMFSFTKGHVLLIKFVKNKDGAIGIELPFASFPNFNKID